MLADSRQCVGAEPFSTPELDLFRSVAATLAARDWLHVIATTRLGEEDLPAARAGNARRVLSVLAVDALPHADAVELVRKHAGQNRFDAATDVDAIGEVVRELGGFTLAVETVALYLALNPEVSPIGYLARLRAEGLTSTDALAHEERIGAEIRHREKQLEVVLNATFGTLKPLEKFIAVQAAELPPDHVVWPWLREAALVAGRLLGEEAGVYGGLQEATVKPGQSDPWEAARRKIEGLRLITRGTHADYGRMHRLVAAYALKEASALQRPQRWQPRLAVDFSSIVVKSATEALRDGKTRASTRRMLLALEAVAEQWIATRPGADVGQLCITLADWMLSEGSADRAIRFAASATNLLAEESTSHNLATALELLARAHFERERASDRVSASQYAARAVAMRRNLYLSEPSTESALKLAGALDVQSHVLSSRGEGGDLGGALEALQEALRLRRAAFESSREDRRARELSISLERYARFVLDHARPSSHAAAIELLAESLRIREELLTRAPGSIPAARDVSIAAELLCNSLIARGAPEDVSKAREHARRCMELAEANLAKDGDSPQARRDLAYAHRVLAGALSMEPAEVTAACRHFERSLHLREELLKSNPQEIGLLEDVAVSAESLARTLPAEGDEEVDTYRGQLLERALAIREAILEANPRSRAAATRLLSARRALVELYLRRGDIERSISCLEVGLEGEEAQLSAAPRDLLAYAQVIERCDHLAQLRQHRGSDGDMDRAIDCLKRSVDVSRVMADLSGDSADVRNIALSLDALAKALQGRSRGDDVDRAISCFDESLAIAHALWQADPLPSVVAVNDLVLSAQNAAAARFGRGGPGDHEQAEAIMGRAQLLVNDS